ncbi:hypothetical protein GBS0709_21500 [Edwardsiella tarda]|nr:hypothetical protein GBS0709_21500 [Edwardsiella tarda]
MPHRAGIDAAMTGIEHDHARRVRGLVLPSQMLGNRGLRTLGQQAGAEQQGQPRAEELAAGSGLW